MDPGLFFQEALEGMCAVHRHVLAFSTFRITLRTGIAQFVGSWVSESGYRLHIRRVCKDQACVDFLDPRGAPIGRSYMGGAPSIRMIAHYDDYYEDFRVDLWEESKGFTLHLDHEYDYVLGSEQREALVPSISRYERDRFLDAYYSFVWPAGSLCSNRRTTRACECASKRQRALLKSWSNTTTWPKHPHAKPAEALPVTLPGPSEFLGLVLL